MAEPKADRLEGEVYLQLKDPKTKISSKERFVVVEENTLFYYSDKDPDNPKGSIPLRDCKIESQDKKRLQMRQRRHSFTITTPQGHVRIGAKDQGDAEKWLQTLKTIVERPPSGSGSPSGLRTSSSSVSPSSSSPRSSSSKVKGVKVEGLGGKKHSGKTPRGGGASSKHKPSILQRAEKNVVQKAAQTILGRKLIEKYAKELVHIMEMLTEFTALKFGKPKAKALEKAIMKIVVKVQTLRGGNFIKNEQFHQVRMPLLQVWNTFTDCGCSFSRDIERLCGHFKIYREAMTVLLGDHLSKKSMDILNDTLGFFENPVMWDMFFSEENKRVVQIQEKMMDTMTVLWNSRVNPAYKKELLDGYLKDNQEEIENLHKIKLEDGGGV
eukprot:TRINITY_DN2510_c0_g1_i1.p1 TRINITY_DN2510_c0_g1~~TRINITY_DN2510_c0_g1_i1.p1  ORF type:complete len:438 (+),score=73.01 TRINITY_DN2510_c0_g1_i1:171-1316(+)